MKLQFSFMCVFIVMLNPECLNSKKNEIYTVKPNRMNANFISLICATFRHVELSWEVYLLIFYCLSYSFLQRTHILCPYRRYLFKKKKKKKKKKNNESMYQDAVLHENMSCRLTKEEHSNQLSHLYCLIRVLYVWTIPSMNPANSIYLDQFACINRIFLAKRPQWY